MVTGVAAVTPLVNPTDVVTIEDQFAEIAVKYATARVCLKESGGTFTAMAQILQDMMRDVRTMALWKEFAYSDEWVRKQGK